MYTVRYFILNFFLFLLPSALFFKITNLLQTPIKITSYFFLIQFLIFFFIYLSSRLLHKNFKNIKSWGLEKLEKNQILLLLLLFYFLSFFYSDLIKYCNKIYHFDKSKLSFLDAFLVLLLYLSAFYWCLVILIKKKIFKNFVTIFIILNYIYIFFNYFDEINKDVHVYNNVKSEIELDNTYSNTNIYYFLLDGMMSLERAQENGIINNQNEIINEFKNINALYIPKSYSNYSVTYLSVHSMLDMSYTLNEESQKYSFGNKEIMFPYTLINEKNYPQSIIMFNKLNTRFFWTGNAWASCTVTVYVNCLEISNANLIYLIIEFYNLTPLKYLLKFVKIPKEDTKIIENPEKFFFKIKDIINDKKKYNNNFFFFHLMFPHYPTIGREKIYIYDENCNYKFLTNKDYDKTYKCALKKIKPFIQNLNKVDQGEKIIVISADHGWNLRGTINENIPMVINNKFNSSRENEIKDKGEIFNLILSPKRCGLDKLKDVVKSPINNIKFIFNCAYNLNLPYSENIHYKAFYQTDRENFGDVMKYNFD